MEETQPLITKIENDNSKSYGPLSTPKKIISLLLAIGVAVLVIATISLVITSSDKTGANSQLNSEGTIFNKAKLSQTHSQVGQYSQAAVATDNRDCASIGIKVLSEMKGSAVDAAIATALCTGLQTMDSSGIGGGHFMVGYERPRGGGIREFFSMESREKAPSGASVHMYDKGGSPSKGGLAVAVPGEIAGYYEAWKEFGRVPWKDLFKPSIKMAREGIYVDNHLAEKISQNAEDILRDPGLREVLSKEDGSLAKEGDYVQNKKLARSLERIAEGGAMVFYNGSLAQDILEEIKGFGGIITKHDLATYIPIYQMPFNSDIDSKDWQMHSSGPPSSGPVLQFMIQLLDGYGFTPEDLKGDNISTTYQRIVETLKFGYAHRTFLGDPDYTDLNKLYTPSDYIENIRSKITDDKTHGEEYYHPAGEVVSDGGTSHISVLTAEGAAVSLTSTINMAFGAKIMGTRTGIIYNNEMDDFSQPGSPDGWELRPSERNFIEGGKRPVSSMCPTIITNSRLEVQMVLGASGGSRITSAALYALAHSLWLGKPINGAIDLARLHHQLQPNKLNYEEGFSQRILRSLAQKGHETEFSNNHAAVQAIHNTCGDCKTRGCHRNCIIAVSDKRKGGVPDGY